MPPPVCKSSRSEFSPGKHFFFDLIIIISNLGRGEGIPAFVPATPDFPPPHFPRAAFPRPSEFVKFEQFVDKKSASIREFRGRFSRDRGVPAIAHLQRASFFVAVSVGLAPYAGQFRPVGAFICVHP